jgi:NAD(P)H-dependent FMN reductase
LIDLGDYDLVFCGEEDENSNLEDVLRLRRDVGEAQGIILGTPEYHGSFSGVLKNALDLMGFAEIEGKMIGLVGCSGGAMGASDALCGLRAVARALHAWVIPEQVCIPEAYKAFNETGQPSDPALARRLNDLGRNVVRFAALHSSRDAQEFQTDLHDAVPPLVEV